MNDKKDEALKADESQIEVESPTTESEKLEIIEGPIDESLRPAEVEDEAEATESTEEEAPEASTENESRKTANSRIRELVAEKKEAEKQASEERAKAESLAEQMKKFTTPQLPTYQPPQETADGEITVDEVLRRADALTQIRLAQMENLNRVNNEALEAIREYPELDPKSDSFDAELSESISKATMAQVQANPTASVKDFVSGLMKPYRRSIEKQASSQKETITKQVSEQAMRPTQVQEQEKPFSELSIEEMEKQLGVVHR